MIRNVNRRTFLRRSIHCALGGAGLYSALGNLQLVAAASRAGSKGDAGYKALVCVYLFGGNDSFNTIVPRSAPHYAQYLASRPAMALSQVEAAGLPLNPQAVEAGLPGGPARDRNDAVIDFGLHPGMGALQALFNNQHAAIVGNVGTLLGPITQAEYQGGVIARPPQLFSHEDQTNFWQTSRPDDANADGWGGRIADLLHASYPGQDLPMTISLSGQALFQRGANVDQYVMNPYGVQTLDYLNMYLNEEGAQTFHALNAQGTQAHMFERAYAGATRRAIDTYETVNSALDNDPTPPATVFPDSNLGAQLRQVANLISVRGALGMQRQVFYVALGGFDTHDSQLEVHPGLLADLSDSLAAFHAATIELGVEDSVTAFTASDFGRTVSTNGDGTDHGWGGHHFVVGGAVRGGRFFGTMPSLVQNANPDDAGYGQIIPTTGVDQYAATLASWFGVDAAGIADIFPGLGLYDYDTDNLGFML